MTSEDFNAAAASGKVTVVQPATPPASSTPSTPRVDLSQFLPLLTALQSVKKWLSAAPTSVPQTFVDQLQFIFDGSNYYLYFYANNQWNQVGSSGAGGSAAGRSHNPTLANIPINSGSTPFSLGLQTNDFAGGITWDATNKQFVCTTAGKYTVYLQVSYVMPAGSFSGAASFYALIYQNGAEVSRGSQIPGSGLQPVEINVSDVLDLAIGDAITFYAMTDHPQSVNIEAASNLTYAYITG